MVEGGSLSEHDTESGFHGYALSFNHPVVYVFCDAGHFGIHTF